MQALIVYESFYGNTRKIAYAIAKGISQNEACQVLQVNEVSINRLMQTDFLIVGSPTVGFHLSPVVFKLIDSLTYNSLAGIYIAAFDTRIQTDGSSFTAQPIFLTSFTHSAIQIAEKLVEKGGLLITAPQGFLVHTPKGPLVDGELHRATLWGALLTRNYHQHLTKKHRLTTRI